MDITSNFFMSALLLFKRICLYNVNKIERRVYYEIDTTYICWT